MTRGRRFLNWLNVGLMCFFMGAVLVGVNLIAHSRYARIDMTTDKVWEISDQSRQILRSAKYDLEIYLNAIGDSEDRSLPEAWRRTQLLLFEMASQNPKIKVIPIDPRNNSHAAVTALFSTPMPNSIYFVYRTPGDKPLSRVMAITDLYNANPATGEVAQFFAESRIVTTIAQLISDRKLKIYATTEHKEPPPQKGDRLGLSLLSGRLASMENAEFKPLNLQRDKAVPDDADLVFIAWPGSDFTTVETDALTKYWARGGRIFVAAHPIVPDELTEFRRFLETCGIKLNRDIVLDTQREIPDAAGGLAVRNFQRHPINQSMYGAAIRVDQSSSVDAGAVNKRMQAMPLFFSSEACWTEQDLPPKPGVSRQSPGERWGPVPLAAVSEELVAPGKASRIIVWGSVLPLLNQFNLIQDQPDDFRLTYMMNNFRWLTEREFLIADPQAARQTRMKPFAPTPGGDAVIGWVSLAGIPLVGVVLGVLALYFRRK